MPQEPISVKNSKSTNSPNFSFKYDKFTDCFLYQGDQKISWGEPAGGRRSTFEIHLCSFGVNSDLGECFFWGLCKLVIASTHLWPQEMFTFWKCLQWSCLKAVSVPTFVIGGFRGSTAMPPAALVASMSSFFFCSDHAVIFWAIGW